MPVNPKRFEKPLPRFLISRDMGRVFVIHTATPRFIAEVVHGPEPLSKAAMGYRTIDNAHEWAAKQPEGSEAAMSKLMHDVRDFYVAYLDSKHSLS